MEGKSTRRGSILDFELAGSIDDPGTGMLCHAYLGAGKKTGGVDGELRNDKDLDCFGFGVIRNI